jgi:sensor c-di-GMP phosphodiesterase-like protein
MIRAPTRLLAASAVFALALLASLAWSDWTTLDSARGELRTMVQAVDQRSSQVRSEGIALAAKLPDGEECDRNQLRALIADSHYVRDVGRIRDTRVYCNAMDGAGARIQLGEPDVSRSDGVRMWIQAGTLWAARGHSVLRMDTVSFVDMPIPPDTRVAMLESESGRLLVHSGPLPKSLLAAAARLRHGELRQDGHLAAVSESQDGRTIDVAARPMSAIEGGYLRALPRSLALGAVAGLLGVALVLGLFASRDSLLSELRRALRTGKLGIALQPIVEASVVDATARVVGFECLARWTRANGEEVPPDAFVPMSEAAGLGSELARCVVTRLLADFGDCLRSHPYLYVALNLAPADIADVRLLDDLDRLVIAAGIPPSQLVIELTERTIEAAGLAAGLARLRRAGHRLSIDDFGTGVSNASRLAAFNPEIVKVDRSFLLHADTASHAAELLPQLVAMARGCGAKVVVEGVETREQAALLAGYGDVFGQGYFWHRPLPPAAAAQLLQPAR